MIEPDIDLSDPIHTRLDEGLIETVEIARAADELVAEEHDRSKHVGGGDIAAVMGLSPWLTPVELWQLKTHRVVPEVTPQKARIYRRGHKLEPFIREMTIDKLQDMGLQVELVAVNRRYKHPAKPYLAAEIDFELKLTGAVMVGDDEVVFDGEHVNSDAKSVTGFARKKWGDVGTDEIPIEYAAQFMHGLGITNRKWCLVAALRSFDDVDIYWVQRDDETIAAMFGKAVLFWEEHVLKDIPPDPVNFADVKLLFEKATTEDMLPADEEVAAKVRELKNVKSAISELEKTAETLAFEVTKVIGDKRGIALAGKPLCTWGNERSTKFQQKEFAAAHPELAEQFTKRGFHRVLRIK